LVDHYGWGIIYISQTLDFRVPVRIGDKVKIVFKGEVYLPKNRLQLFVDVSVMDQTVVEGQALIIIPFKKEF
jgi:3-hydroxybutyryl-CoA dehydratase